MPFYFSNLILQFATVKKAIVRSKKIEVENTYRITHLYFFVTKTSVSLSAYIFIHTGSNVFPSKSWTSNENISSSGIPISTSWKVPPFSFAI